MSNPSRLIRTLALASAVLAVVVADPGAHAAPKKKPAARASAKSKASKPAAKGKAAGRTTSGPRASGGRQALDLKKESSALPQSQALKTPVATKSLAAVKPPRSDNFYEGTKEAQYEQLVDQEINALYKLSQANRRSQNRGEIWLRLGERYVEKARLVSFREQSEFDKKLADYNAKKTKIRPKIDWSLSREYNKKAVQLYEWFVNDFPKDPKVDQALFFLGYNQFELDNPKEGERYYLELVQRFPDSPYVTESRFALGEYYFENEQWRKALDNYNQVIAVKKARLNSFALYKAAWCYYRLGQTPLGLKNLERVIRMARAGDQGEGAKGGGRAVNKIRLGVEATKDYVPFYAETGDPRRAASEFMRVTGDEKAMRQMMERLAYIYADAGNRASATYTFKQLISMNPAGEKSAEYQYQIVLAYATTEPKTFRAELENWLEGFGPNSFWAKENEKNQKLVSDVAKLQETTVRNNVLQLHQTAQNARTESSQKAAAGAYALYFKYFAEAPQAVEMRFFQAELLYDMQRWADAAKLYLWVVEKDPKGPYYDKALVASILALEKDLPSEAEIEAKRGKSIEEMPLDPPVARFEQAAVKFMREAPKHEKTPDVKRRLAVLYYQYNQFDKASALFEEIIRDNPKSDNAQIAGNLLLDIYKLKNDMIGFAAKGQELLANPAIASTKFGGEVRTMLEKASFMRADELAKKGDHLTAAKEFERYATNYKGSELATASRYKAAQSFEKGGDLVSSSRMYMMVLAAPADPKTKELQNDSRNALARIYQQTGQLELAAKQYRDYAAANAKDPKAINGFYNAAVIFDGLGQTGEATASYESYFAKSRNSDRFEVSYLQAKMYQRKGMRDKMRAYFDKYINDGGRNLAHVIEATFEVAQVVRAKGGITKSKEGWQKVLAMHKRAPGGVKDATASFAAEARFNLAQDTLRELQSVRFTANDKQQASAAVRVKQLRERYIGEMKEVIRYNNAPWIVAALASGGKMFELLADQFEKIPTPAGFKGDEVKQYRALIQQQADGLKAEAKNSYKAAIEKSQELEAYTEWTDVARRGLATLDPQSKQAMSDEIVTDAKATDWMGL